MNNDTLTTICLWVMTGAGAVLLVLVAAGCVNEWRLWRASTRLTAELRAWLDERRGR